LLETASRKKRIVGLLLFLLLLGLFFSLNRFPKLDIVAADLEAVTGPVAECFQGFCIEPESGSSFLSKWWNFSLTYLRLVTIGMIFAFLVAGLTESFLFPKGIDRGLASGGILKRTLRGAIVGPVMNLCSACIVPISAAYHKRGGGVEGAIAMIQGSATMNLLAVFMAFFVFAPLLGVSRLLMALVGAVLIGPVVAFVLYKGREQPPCDIDLPDLVEQPGQDSWGPTMKDAFRHWAKSSLGYLLRMGPIMVVAGFASGLAIQWISPDTVSTYLGNHLQGVAIAATLGILINVPLLFEIPLVALLLLLGMGVAPAATLLFTAASGGPITFWGLAKVMPKRAIVTFALAIWAVGAIGGLAVWGFDSLKVETGSYLRVTSATDASEDLAGPAAVSLGERGPLFTDVSERAGLVFHHYKRSQEFLPAIDDSIGASVIILDFNSDGLQDIFLTNSDGPNALFRNNGDSTFTDVAAVAGLAEPDVASNGACAADYDGDGDQDLYLTKYGPSKLFQNNGDGTFTDVTSASGADNTDSTYRSTGCAWGDYDSDGNLDLIVTHHYRMGRPAPTNDNIVLAQYERAIELEEAIPLLARLDLYHNNGDGTFSNVTYLLGDISGPTPGKRGENPGNIWGTGFQPGWADLDNDGDPDLYIVNDFGGSIQPNVLWRNDGPRADGSWIFVDVSSESGADAGIFGMGLAVGDYNLDGFLDMYITNIGNNVLLRNNANGLTFTDTAPEAGVAIGFTRFGSLGQSITPELRVTWGTAFLDYDNDGDEDLYVVSGYMKDGPAPTDEVVGLAVMASQSMYQDDVLLQNNGDGTFTNVALRSGASDSGFGRGGAYLDYNNDGCLDLVLARLGQTPKLLENTCDSGNNWLIVELKGTVSNRSGIGARIEVVAAGATQIREVLSGSSYMGQNMLPAHFGLGKSAQVKSVTVRWPSGAVQTITDVDSNQKLSVTEPEF
jgi:uncharacterized membrane protein YraQ (UPF0718 family)